MATRLMHAGGALSAVGLFLAFPSHPARAIPIGNPHTTSYQEGELLGRLLTAAFVAGLWLWMSWAVRRGKGWARVVSTVFFLLGAEPAVATLLEQRWASAVILTLATLAGMATILLLYQQDSSAFFASGRASAGYAPPPLMGGTAADYRMAAPEVIDQESESAPPQDQPTYPAALRRMWPAVAAVSAVAAAIVGAFITDVVVGIPKMATNTAGSTANVQVIVPAPVDAGGLLRDYSAENSPTFRSSIATARQHYLQVMHASAKDITIAIYSGAPAASGAGPVVTLVYIGVNSHTYSAKRGTAVDLIGGAAAQMTHVKAATLPGGPGDTTYACATGLAQGRTIAICGWSTDRSLGELIQTSPGGTISELGALMMKMRPDLVRN